MNLPAFFIQLKQLSEEMVYFFGEMHRHMSHEEEQNLSFFWLQQGCFGLRSVCRIFWSKEGQRPSEENQIFPKNGNPSLAGISKKQTIGNIQRRLVTNELSRIKLAYALLIQLKIVTEIQSNILLDR